ncbi:MAG: P-loop NTPase fold protein [Gammaproteobacteria bacterium]
MQTNQAVQQHFSSRAIHQKREIFLQIFYLLSETDMNRNIVTTNLKEALNLSNADYQRIINYLFQKKYIEKTRVGEKRLGGKETYKITVEGIDAAETQASREVQIRKIAKSILNSVGINGLAVENSSDDEAVKNYNIAEEAQKNSEEDRKQKVAHNPDKSPANDFKTNSPRKFSTNSITDSQIPIYEDALNHAVYANALVDFITNKNFETPFSICLSSSWGTGKTNIMNWTKEKLDLHEKQYTTVWFNAWKYKKNEEIWSSFAKKLSLEIINKKGKYALQLERFKSSFINNRLLCYSIFLLLTLFSVFLLSKTWPELLPFDAGYIYGLILTAYALMSNLIAAIIKFFSSPLIKFAYSTKGPEYDKKLGFLYEFEKDLKTLIKLSSSKDTPLIIFIDDLDRAPPPIAADIIEAINLLLDKENCVYVFSFDPNIVYASIETKYHEIISTLNSKASTQNYFSGRAFFEKFFQLAITLPEPSDEHIQQYMRKLLDYNLITNSDGASDDIDIKNDDKHDESINSNTAIAEATEEKQEEFIEEIDESEEIKQHILYSASLLPNNPRKVKRFINAFRFNAFVANRKGLIEAGIIDLFHLGNVLVAALEYPEVYELFRSDPYPGNIIEMTNWIESSNSEPSKVLQKYGINSKHKSIKLLKLCNSLSNLGKTSDYRQAYVSLSDVE